MYNSSNPVTPLLGIYPKEILPHVQKKYIHKNNVALFGIVRNCKQLKEYQQKNE